MDFAIKLSSFYQNVDSVFIAITSGLMVIATVLRQRYSPGSKEHLLGGKILKVLSGLVMAPFVIGALYSGLPAALDFSSVTSVGTLLTMAGLTGPICGFFVGQAFADFIPSTEKAEDRATTEANDAA